MTSDTKGLTREQLLEATEVLRNEDWNSTASAIEDTDAALRARITALEEALNTVVQVWSHYWDCSRDPGHPLMNEAVTQARQAFTPPAAAQEDTP